MPYANKTIIMGNLVREPELRYTNDGTPVCSFTIATNRFIGERKEVYFADCVIFGKQAENVARYTQKGSCVYVEGHHALDQWQGRDGKMNSKTIHVVSVIQFLDRRRDAEPEQYQEQPEANYTQAPAINQQYQQSGHKYPREDVPQYNADNTADIAEEDIPF